MFLTIQISTFTFMSMYLSEYIWCGLKYKRHEVQKISKSYIFCPNMTNDTSLESSCALLLESAKKLQICKNWTFYRKIQLHSKNVCKKNLSKKWKIIHFWKVLDHVISNMQKILNNLSFNQEKLTMCKFPLTGCLQKICNFFRKTCAIRFFKS